MRSHAIGLLLTAVLAGCGNPSHGNVKIKSLHGWESGRAKSCMLFNGGSVVEGGKRGSDPKEMQCVDHKKEDPNDMAWEFVYVGKVVVDDKSEEVFRHTEKHFAVPLLCTRTDTRIFSCVYDADR
jgi:hypothetical protein